MTKTTRARNKRRAALLALLTFTCSICTVRGNPLIKEPTMPTPAMNLWQIIHALTSNSFMSKESVEQALSIKFQEQPHPSNDAYVFYEAHNLALSGGSVVSQINASRKKADAMIGAIGLDIGGSCITREAVRSRYANLKLTGAPRGRSLEESTAFSATMDWGTISFGFKEKNPECLSNVALRFK